MPSQPKLTHHLLDASKSGAFFRGRLGHCSFCKLEGGKSVLAIGPGLGTHPQTQEFIRTIVTQTELPVVLDADGLNAFDGHMPSLCKRKTKLLAVTPHPGEMARLLGGSPKGPQARRPAVGRGSALPRDAHVNLKRLH